MDDVHESFMEIGMEDRCANCRFYRAPYREGGLEGYCHRYPPAPPAPKSLLWVLAEICWFVAGEEETANNENFNPEGKGADDNDKSLFPIVYNDDWCGEFQKAPQQNTGTKASVLSEIDGVSSRALNALERLGIYTTDDVLRYEAREDTAGGIDLEPGVGPSSVRAIREAIRNAKA